MGAPLYDPPWQRQLPTIPEVKAGQRWWWTTVTGMNSLPSNNHLTMVILDVGVVDGQERVTYADTLDSPLDANDWGGADAWWCPVVTPEAP